ncbi:MAG: flagellar protein export ATPase FliI [Chloroflexota bacterium]
MADKALLDFDAFHRALTEAEILPQCGRVVQVVGVTIESEGPGVNIGQLCHVYPAGGGQPLMAEVVGFRDARAILMPLGQMDDVGPGCEVRALGSALSVKVGPGLLGRVLDGLGRPFDGRGPIGATGEYPANGQPPNPITRTRISTPLSVGVRAIDGILTCGKGQRLGIFAGSGVGKSTLLGMVARNTEADINVIALVGERGREVRDFIERDLGPEGLKRSVVVVATSDQPALIRIKAAFVATAIAEYFRDQGLDVLLMMDSVTRFAMAQRELGLAIGEPPATRGYTPSVFALLPRLLERSGTAERGTITGFYTVLVEGDDMNEPIADAVRGILDGHIVLSRALASQNHYPAIDILESISRVMIEIVPREQTTAAGRLRAVLATYREAADLINIGAYVAGSNPDIDHALAVIEPVNQFLRQGINEQAPFAETAQRLYDLFPVVRQ